MLLEVAAVKVLAHVGAALHALQHGHLNGNIRTGFRCRREAGARFASSFSTAFLLSQRSACPKKSRGETPNKVKDGTNNSSRNRWWAARWRCACAYLDCSVLLRGQVNSSKNLAERAWGRERGGGGGGEHRPTTGLAHAPVTHTPSGHRAAPRRRSSASCSTSRTCAALQARELP